MTPQEYCETKCQYRDTLNCDYRLKCCPMWDYIHLSKQNK